ncbi:MAG: alpha/beta fold hydrolase [Actinomycetota bacterium]|nr:alpha/beta fold hydrolase [Actinomycetota bacterium]
MSDDADLAEVAAPLDLLLSDAATGPMRRFLPGSATVRFALGLARRPRPVTTKLAELTVELARIGLRRSDLEPDPKDKRFVEPAWKHQPGLRAMLQAYLAVGRAVSDVRREVDLEWSDATKVDFALDNILDAVAPSNNPLLNPLTYKAVIDTGGRSVLRGVRNLVSDAASPPRVPSMVAPNAFAVGESLALTEGAVVLRTAVFELIQYGPQTEKVSEIPLVIAPPTINKYYVLDLAPGRSFVEHLVKSGHQVFMMSWRNPDRRHHAWDLSTYGQAVLEAMGAARSITGSTSASLLGLCSGGIITSMVMAHLVDTGRAEEVASFALGVSLLDQRKSGLANAALDDRAAAEAVNASARAGFLDGRALAEVFAWLRPNDLIWGYWVNNYLQGKAPKAFDVLFWNSDTTRMTAGLHRDFIELAINNSLTEPGASAMLGSPVDLSSVKTDSYVVAGIADHICPWQNCYQSSQMLGGDTRFVLSTAGHVASIVNPPDNPKARFRVAPSTPESADEWMEAAQEQQGSWWVDYQQWLADRSGDRRSAPTSVGNSRFPVESAAPGTYVFDT